MQVELTKKEVGDILGLLNTSSFQGKDAKYAVALIDRFEAAQKEDDGKRDTGDVS